VTTKFTKVPSGHVYPSTDALLTPQRFCESLKDIGVTFFTGVPDSLLEHFCAYIQQNIQKKKHIIAANEGNAVALAAGHYIATGNPACVYLQNSGLGNTVNPLTSLVDPLVYGIPLLLLVGWRSEPGVADEPQHIKQGAITNELLDTLGVAHEILPRDEKEVAGVLARAIKHMRKKRAPYALVVKKGTFASYIHAQRAETEILLREQALHVLLEGLRHTDIVVSTTGKTSREVFEYREQKKQGHERDFLTVGSMGHASSLALALALARPERTVWCLDGDGAAIMHMGALATIGVQQPKNLIHVVLNNAAHESVGGQPTAASQIDLKAIARGCRYPHVFSATGGEALVERLKEIQALERHGPIFLEIKLKQGSRKDLGRPTQTPRQNMEALMQFLGELL